MPIILPNLNHSFISLVPVPVKYPDFLVFHTPVVNEFFVYTSAFGRHHCKSRMLERMEIFQNDCCRPWTKKLVLKNSCSRQLQ